MTFSLPCVISGNIRWPAVDKNFLHFSWYGLERKTRAEFPQEKNLNDTKLNRTLRLWFMNFLFIDEHPYVFEKHICLDSFLGTGLRKSKWRLLITKWRYTTTVNKVMRLIVWEFLSTLLRIKLNSVKIVLCLGNDTKLHLMVWPQLWGCRILLPSHYSEVHSDQFVKVLSIGQKDMFKND